MRGPTDARRAERKAPQESDGAEPGECGERAIFSQLRRVHLAKHWRDDEHQETRRYEEDRGDAEQHLGVCTDAQVERQRAEQDAGCNRRENDDERAVNVSSGPCEFSDERPRDGRGSDENDGPEDGSEPSAGGSKSCVVATTG